jgi:oligo-1,6-glucosidase
MRGTDRSVRGNKAAQASKRPHHPPYTPDKPPTMAPTIPRRTWWKESSIYQIYPSSFKDSNGDGIGDIPGIISKLDYLHSLGVDIVWLSPVYASPGKDMGYDISDYRAIDPRYGSMGDLEALVEGLHERGMKLVMDLVVNHTSDAHEWFQESRRSRENEKRDWYVWRDPRYDEQGNRMPPNNWLAVFGGVYIPHSLEKEGLIGSRKRMAIR